jgi:RecA/RadA recombinase
MSIDKFLKDIRKGTNSTSFAESDYGKIKNWISTGDYGINRIISGDIHKGIPSGKVIVFGGESQSGKSYIVANIAANALGEEDYDLIFYFDSEGGALNDFFESKNVDLNKIEQILVDNVEDATVKILNIYKKIEEYKQTNPNAKFLCILDSLGALVPSKLITDAGKGKMVSDMGSRARLINNMMKGLTIPALKTDTSMLVVNHIYDDPSSMFPSKIKNQSGGKGLQYASHLTIQCHKKFEKNEKKKEDGTEYKATILRFFITKNRIIKPFFETEMLLDYNKGSLKWFGLFDPALKYGFIIQSGAFYTVPSYGEKKLRKSQILTSDEIWETFLDDFNETCKKTMSYTPDMDLDNEERINELLDSEELD